MQAIKHLILGAALLVAPAAVEAQTTTFGFGFGAFKALVLANGDVRRPSGVASATHPGTGLYTLLLNRPMNSCVLAVTVGNTIPGYGTVNNDPTDTTFRNVVVRIFNKTGAPADLPFFFTSEC